MNHERHEKTLFDLVVDVFLAPLFSKEGLGEICGLIKSPLNPPLSKGEEDAVNFVSRLRIRGIVPFVVKIT